MRLIICMIFGSFSMLTAQNTLGLGASLSLGTSQLNGDGIQNPQNKLSWSLGGQAQYNLGKYFAVNSGVLLQNKGGKAT